MYLLLETIFTLYLMSSRCLHVQEVKDSDLEEEEQVFTVEVQAKKEAFSSNPFLNFFSSLSAKDSSSFNASRNNPKKEFYKFSKLENISVEYLMIVCRDFTPYELFALAGTCKRLRNLLMSDDAAVQSIWRNSRLQHMRYLQLPPLYLLTEQEYIALTMMERGCQFCGQRKNWVRVHWRFQVRSCYECYKPRFLR